MLVYGSTSTAQFLITLGCLALLHTSACINKSKIPPPVAKVITKEDTLHGEVHIDNYFWLRKKSNPEVIAYLEAENKYTEAMMKYTEKLQKKLYQELRNRIKETDMSVPVKKDNYYYYTRTEKGKQYPIYCRKKDSLKTDEKILLDQNKLAKGHKYFKIGAFEISPDHKLLAYSFDTSGSEHHTLKIKNLQSGTLLPDEIPNTAYSIEWAADNKTIFYTSVDETELPHRLYRHKLGTDPKKDVLVYDEKDLAFSVYLYKTRSREYLLLEISSHTTTEVYYLKTDQPHENFKLVHPRQHNMEYYIYHHTNNFYILTNDNAKNFKVMITPDKDPSKKNWQEIIPHRDSVKIDDIDLFKNHLVVYERENGLKTIHITNLTHHKTHYVKFPEPIYTFWKGKNPNFNTNILRFNYSSLVTPQTVFDYNMNTRSRELKKQYEVKGYDSSQFQSERIFAKAPDGTKIPISLVYKKSMVKNGNNPLILYGYGAYGSSEEPYFSRNRVSLINRGFIDATAHVRGGGEMGRYWWEQGKLFQKKNTFTDFIACAEHLIAQKYTSSDKLIIQGESAGGLLIGAVTNMRPDLFKGVVAEVPFVDVINTMLDPSIPLTVLEFEEWGNPEDKEYYEYMKSYSPYDNVAAKNYPHILVTAGLNDPRVQYWEPAKWTAKLRTLKTNRNLLLLKTNMGAGHGGASGRYDYLKEIAFVYAFILDLFQIKE